MYESGHLILCFINLFASEIIRKSNIVFNEHYAIFIYVIGTLADNASFELCEIWSMVHPFSSVINQRRRWLMSKVDFY